MLGRHRTADLIKQVQASTKSTNYASPLTDSVRQENALALSEPTQLEPPQNSDDQRQPASLTRPTIVDYRLAAFDQGDYLSRLNAVLTYSDRHGEWIGLKNFINLYFSTVFHAFFGEQVNMHLIHIEKRTKLFAHFSLRSKQSYRIIIMLNYSLWDKIILAAAALPDLYFRLPERGYLDKAALFNPTAQTVYLDQPTPSDTLSLSSIDQAPSGKGRWYEVSLSALCIVHRLEMIMFADLSYQHASHVVTLGKFFANNNQIKNPFVIGTLYD